jgi:hypothetical protein
MQLIFSNVACVLALALPLDAGEQTELRLTAQWNAFAHTANEWNQLHQPGVLDAREPALVKQLRSNWRAVDSALRAEGL